MCLIHRAQSSNLHKSLHVNSSSFSPLGLVRSGEEARGEILSCPPSLLLLSSSSSSSSSSSPPPPPPLLLLLLLLCCLSDYRADVPSLHRRWKQLFDSNRRREFNKQIKQTFSTQAAFCLRRPGREEEKGRRNGYPWGFWGELIGLWRLKSCKKKRKFKWNSNTKSLTMSCETFVVTENSSRPGSTQIINGSKVNNNVASYSNIQYTWHQCLLHTHTHTHTHTHLLW